MMHNSLCCLIFNRCERSYVVCLILQPRQRIQIQKRPQNTSSTAWEYFASCGWNGTVGLRNQVASESARCKPVWDHLREVKTVAFISRLL